jgi:CRP/FNR family cyclic AMP-dependent transcriptional regulator
MQRSSASAGVEIIDPRMISALLAVAPVGILVALPGEERNGDPVDAKLLCNIPMFSGLAAEDLSALMELLEARQYTAHQPIVYLGDTGADLFVVHSGKVIVSYPDESGKEVLLAEMGPGSFFGEISLLDGGPRTANVRAETAVDLLVLKRETFVQFLLRHPAAAVHILTVLGGRQRDILARLRGIRNVNDAVSSEQTPLHRLLARVARVFASEKFLLANLVVFAAWIGVNMVLRGKGLGPFDDPPTFFWLGFMISVEAIVIAMFVLNSQRRQAERDRIRADLEYQVNVKAHMEVMELQRKVDRLIETADRDRR